MANNNLEVRTIYGRRKLDADAYNEQLARKGRTLTKSGVRYGKRKGDVEEPAPEQKQPDKPAGPAANPFLVTAPDGSTRRLQVRASEQLLKLHPEMLDAAIAAEFKSDLGQPRPSMLEVLLKLEQAKESPRPRVLALLRVSKGRAAPAAGEAE